MRFPFRREKRTIYDAIEKFRKLLRRKDAKSTKAILGAWYVAESSILAKLEAVVAKIVAAQSKGGDASFVWLIQQQRYIELLASIRTEIDRFGGKASAHITALQKEYVSLGLHHATELIRTAGVSSGFIRLPKEAVENIVGQLSDGSPLRDLFAKMGPEAVSKASQIFASEMAAGQHPRKIAARIHKEIGATKNRALVIARTESIRAYREANIENFRENSHVVQAYRWTSSRDSRTCPLCLSRDGQVFDLSEKFGTHPACRCALAPVVKHFDVDRGTGEEWLAKQPDGVQKQILGPSRYRMWKDGDISLYDISKDHQHPRWGKSIKPRTISELQSDVMVGQSKRVLPRSVSSNPAGPASRGGVIDLD